MSLEALKEKLKELHVTLGQTASVDAEDAELAQLLQTLDNDIRTLLVKQEPDDTGLTNRAQAILSRFAVKHPHLDPVLRELADMLASIGI